MFFDDERIVAVREMIVAAGRGRPPAPRLPSCCRPQRSDFVALFRIMAGLPVTIRLLDPPPARVFCPAPMPRSRASPRPAGVTFEALRARIAQLHETNPMLGHRGCRLGISYPEIYEMQGARHLRGGGRGPTARTRPSSKS